MCVDDDEAMKQGNEALKASSLEFFEALNASKLHHNDFLLRE
jgi:hypothetical protein